MSVGPSKPQPHFEVSRMDRIQNATKKIIVEYFENPLRYLFYISLTGLVVSLFFHRNLPWEYYLITVLLGGLEIKKEIKK